MLANWVKQGTSTTGTGTITLDGTPPAGYVAFKDAFIDGQGVFYAIEDGNNREVGYGELTAGANWTLTRGFVHEKLEGGVYERFPATPLNLSGSAIVTIDSTAQSMIGAPLLNSQSASATRTGLRMTHMWVSPYSWSTFTMSPDVMYLWPMFFGTAAKVLGIAVRINTAGTSGTKMSAGLYALSPEWRTIGRKLLEVSGFDPLTSGTQVQALASPVYLNPGWYWVACASDGNPVLDMYRDVESPGQHGVMAFGNYPKRIYTREDVSLTSGWTSLPSGPFPGITSLTATHIPMIHLDVV